MKNRKQSVLRTQGQGPIKKKLNKKESNRKRKQGKTLLKT
jgi:hypothetical protein